MPTSKTTRASIPPDISRADTYADTAHLLRRAGFGAAPDALAQAAAAGVGSTVNALVDYENTPDDFVPPPDLAISDLYRYNTAPLAAWWIGRMISTQRQLQEKMVLFWHGHFATANSKVNRSSYMYGQNQIFRTLALGSFDDILNAVFKDPAMLIWLDGTRNTRGIPNENYGREVMELFTLGDGNYTEDDVHGMARAFTGWRLDDTGAVTFNPRLFDNGIKTILGQTGPWGASDANRILAAHPATGPFLAEKLWRFFASDILPASAITAMSSVYYSSNHSIREMVRTMFMSPEFYAEATRTGHIKSPTEFVVTTIRALGVADKISTEVLPAVLTMLGQQLFNPPNVGGWNSGPGWINAATMLARFNFAARLTGTASTNPGRAVIDPVAFMQNVRADTTQQLMYAVADLLGFTPTQFTAKALMGYVGQGLVDEIVSDDQILGLLHLALVSPEYQAS